MLILKTSRVSKYLNNQRNISIRMTCIRDTASRRISCSVCDRYIEMGKRKIEKKKKERRPKR